MTEAYPLQWPQGKPRTAYPEHARFKTTLAAARDGLLDELSLFGVSDWNVVISSNLELRRDGLPYASQRPVADAGVAVYFMKDQTQHVFACDRWKSPGDNLQAIRKTIAALRGIARWGTGDMVDAAFTGFTALPPPSDDDWRRVLGVGDPTSLQIVRIRYRELARAAHPDTPGGSAEKMSQLNAAYEAARKALGT